MEGRGEAGGEDFLGILILTPPLIVAGRLVDGSYDALDHDALPIR